MPSVSIQRRQNKWTDLCFHHKCYYIRSWECMHPSCILFQIGLNIWIKGNNVLCNTPSEPHLSPLLFGRTRPIIDQINLKELADTLWMKRARSYKLTHARLRLSTLWSLHQSCFLKHPLDLWATGDDDICLAIAPLQIYPSFSHSLRHRALKQSRQEEHFILWSFNNLWMVDYKLM